MDNIELNMSEVEVTSSTKPLRAAWTRETFDDFTIDFKSYSISSVFRAVNRVSKIKELYGIGN
jgi:hypothetical protein